MKIAVLAYHSQNITGNEYESNDHIALVKDLRTIMELEIPIVRLRAAVDCWLAGNGHLLPPSCVAISCDDGTILDWEDFDHPTYGPQSSFRSIIRSHAAKYGLDAGGYLTSFVIASPKARREIDEGCYGGLPLSDDRWWAPAQAEGFIDIENHSWDHVHQSVGVVAQENQLKGDFREIYCLHDAHEQIRQSADYIDHLLSSVGHKTTLFAYPYLHSAGR